MNIIINYNVVIVITVLKYSPNAQFRILANGKYHPYNQYLTKP